MARKLSLLVLSLFAALGRLEAQAPAAGVSFRQDIMPVLFRAGCNTGACHGSARGKDGFRLSLFGFDPAGDYFRLTQQMVGRRVDLAVPQESLLLLKATGKVPHTGGKLFDAESPYYQTLLGWITAGAPDDAAGLPVPMGIELAPRGIVFEGQKRSQATVVTARYSDGSTRDVTHLARFSSNNKTVADIDENGLVSAGAQGDTFMLARFSRFTIGAEVIVLADAGDYHWSEAQPYNYIDDLVHARLRQLRLLPSEVSDDETFLRRVSLDLIGLLPTVDEYRRFMADRSPDKRARLIDALLEREEFTDLWTAKWGEWLKLMGSGYTPLGTDDKAAETYFEWIHQQIEQHVPLDQFVRSQITATGSNLTDGPVNLYTMLPQSPRFQPLDMARDVAQLFTGIRIQCAQCHNHPFDRWTMDDYYSFVSFFSGLTRKEGAEPREFYIFNNNAAPPAKHLLDERPMPPRGLGEASTVPPGVDPRAHLAEWLTAPENPFFARNMANRIWSHFFNRGIVEPVDDLRVSNPPSNQPLLDGLTAKLIEHKFDLRALARDICNSRAYQASYKPNATNGGDERQFSRARLRRLRADVLLDAIARATEQESSFGNFPAGTRAVQFYPRGHGEFFLETFGRSQRATVCSCETRSESTLSQVLHLTSGAAVNDRLEVSPVLSELLADHKTPAAIVEELYIRTLTRQPTPAELAAQLSLLGERPDRRAVQDVFWALLNSSEFVFNH